MTDRDRLIELIIQGERSCSDKDCAECEYINNDRILCDTYNLADYLLANGVVVLDTNIVTTKNRPLIETVANMPLNDVLDLVRAKEEGRLIVPPCKVGDYVKIEGIESFLQVESIHYYRNGLPKIGVTDGRIAITFTIIERFEVFTKEEAEAKLKELK